MNGKHILIIGAGLGGLTAALALQKAGCRVSVFEKGDTLREFGAGVVITPNAMHALNSLGVGATLTALGRPAHPPVVRDYLTGEIVKQPMPASHFLETYGENFFHMHRGDLHRVLSEAVLANDPDCVHVSHGLVGLSQNGVVTAQFESGATATGDALIGCDGNASTVRSLVFESEPVAYSGQTAYRAMMPIEDVPAAIRAIPNGLFPAPQRMLLHYPILQGKVMNIIGIARQPVWQDEGWAIPTEVSEFEALYSDFHPDVRAMLAAIPPGELFKWGLRDREPLSQWTRGLVTTLGDAAHPMTPFLGQGAVMAIEDATVLGRCVEASASFEEAFARYEAARKTRANGVQLASRERSKALQGLEPGGPSTGRDAESHGLFAYNPALVPI